MFFVSKTVKLLIYLLSPIMIIAIIIFSIFRNIRLCFLPSHRIGEIAGLAGLYIHERKKKNNKKNLDFFFSTHIIANKFLIDFLRKYLIIIPSVFAQPIYKVLKLLSHYIPFLNKFYFYPTYKDRNLIINKSNKIQLDKKYIYEGECFLKKIGIPKKSKIACLIVRDNKYLKDLQPSNDYSYHDYRNCNIENYKKTIMYLISKNYYVFRMGVTYKKELKIKNKKFIDYSKNYRSDFLDIFLAYRCNLVITSVTGWDIVPSYFFKKPVLWTNLAPYHACLPYLDSSVFLPKSYYNIKTKKKISPWLLSKIMIDPLNGHEYKKKGIKLIENSPNEIKKATIQVINLIDKKNNHFKKKDKYISDKMWRKFNQNININGDIYDNKKFPKGNFSISFLKSNKKILKIDG